MTKHGTFEERGCTSGITKGRCWKCNIVWYWKTGRGRLRDTRCPNCGGNLRATAHYTKSAPWKELRHGSTTAEGQ